jgi:putative flippase GtrA
MSRLGFVAKLMSHRFVKFLGVGGLNTLFGFAVYTLFALTELSTFMVLMVSTLAAITFNFFTTGGLVFRDLGLARVPRFLISYAVIFVINLKLIEWLSPMCGGRIWAMAIIVLPMALLSYFIQAWFVFGDKLSSIQHEIHRHLLQLLAAKSPTAKREIVIVLLIFAIFAATFCNFQLVIASIHHLDIAFLIEAFASIK